MIPVWKIRPQYEVYPMIFRVDTDGGVARALATLAEELQTREVGEIILVESGLMTEADLAALPDHVGW